MPFGTISRWDLDHTPLRSLHFILFNTLLVCLFFLSTLHIWDITHSTVKLIQCFHLCGFCLAFHEVYYLLELPFGSCFIIFPQGGFLSFFIVIHCSLCLCWLPGTSGSCWNMFFLLPLSWFWYSAGRVDCSVCLIDAGLHHICLYYWHMLLILGLFLLYPTMYLPHFYIVLR